MADPFGESSKETETSSSEVDDLYSAYIVNSIFNAFLSYTAIMLNIIAIHVIRKTLSLSNPLKTLLLSLAVSDLGVGLLVQPFYIALLVRRILDYSIYAAFVTIVTLFSFASLFGVMALSVDRFLAVHLHLRYQELVTHKRVVAVEGVECISFVNYVVDPDECFLCDFCHYRYRLSHNNNSAKL